MGKTKCECLDDDEYEPPMPGAYGLGTDEGRRGFLEAYIWRGEEALLEAVNHMWKSLNAPKAAHCTLIGYMAGTGGAGKCALIRFLRKALRESLDDGLVQPLHGYDSIDEFHAASMDYFQASYAHYLKTVAKFANIMNGEAPDATHGAVVLEGPWKKE